MQLHKSTSLYNTMPTFALSANSDLATSYPMWREHIAMNLIRDTL